MCLETTEEDTTEVDTNLEEDDEDDNSFDLENHLKQSLDNNILLRYYCHLGKWIK